MPSYRLQLSIISLSATGVGSGVGSSVGLGVVTGACVSAGGVSPSAKAAMGSASSNIAISAANSRFIYFPPVSWS